VKGPQKRNETQPARQDRHRAGPASNAPELIEQRHTGAHRLDDDERADILMALEEIERGEVATVDEAAAVFRRSKDGGSL
jgi:hypothetical protein